MIESFSNLNRADQAAVRELIERDIRYFTDWTGHRIRPIGLVVTDVLRELNITATVSDLFFLTNFAPLVCVKNEAEYWGESWFVKD